MSKSTVFGLMFLACIGVQSGLVAMDKPKSCSVDSTGIEELLWFRDKIKKKRAGRLPSQEQQLLKIMAKVINEEPIFENVPAGLALLTEEELFAEITQRSDGWLDNWERLKGSERGLSPGLNWEWGGGRMGFVELPRRMKDEDLVDYQKRWKKAVVRRRDGQLEKNSRQASHWGISLSRRMFPHCCSDGVPKAPPLPTEEELRRVSRELADEPLKEKRVREYRQAEGHEIVAPRCSICSENDFREVNFNGFLVKKEGIEKEGSAICALCGCAFHLQCLKKLIFEQPYSCCPACENKIDTSEIIYTEMSPPGVNLDFEIALDFIFENNTKALKRLLDESSLGANSTDTMRRTLLHFAATQGNELAICFLVQKGAFKGAFVDACDAFGRTPLHFAAESGREGAVKLLVALGARVVKKDNFGFTPLKLVEEKLKEHVLSHVADCCHEGKITHRFQKEEIPSKKVSITFNFVRGEVEVLIEEAAGKSDKLIFDVTMVFPELRKVILFFLSC